MVSFLVNDELDAAWAALSRHSLLMLNMAPCVRTQPGNDSAKSLLPQGTAPTVPLMFQPLVSFRKVESTTPPGFRPGINVEDSRSYSFGVFGFVTSVPQGANPAGLQEHFAPLSQISFVDLGTPWTHKQLDADGLYRHFGRENREKSLPYFEYQFFVVCFHRSAGTEGPIWLSCFPDSTRTAHLLV